MLADDFDGTNPFVDPVYAEDIPTLFADSDELALISGDGLLEDDPPVCEGNCAPYTGDLTIRPSAPLTICESI